VQNKVNETHKTGTEAFVSGDKLHNRLSNSGFKSFLIPQRSKKEA
jgi:hypothetical protein